jgi:hypothetical protein
MLAPLLLGCATLLISMGIQIFAVVVTLRYLIRIISAPGRENDGILFDMYIICVVMLVLFVGHLVQVGVWAGIFLYLGEFENFLTSFYHSLVNFASLGYGDIVMSEEWRLLGALESSIGVLMFGLSAGIMVAIMTPLFARHGPSDEEVRNLRSQ